MAAPIPTTEPVRLTQGDTHKFTRLVPDYSAADGWVLTYYWVSLDGTVEVTVTGAQNGAGAADFLVTIDDTKAAEFTDPATYLWRAVVTQGSESITVDRGRLEILDPLTGAGDRRNWLERTIAALEARIEGRASVQTLSTSVAGRAVSMMTLDEAITVRDRLRQELDALLAEEARQNGERRSSAVRVRLWEG